jgi:hypothetical protein
VNHVKVDFFGDEAMPRTGGAGGQTCTILPEAMFFVDLVLFFINTITYYLRFSLVVVTAEMPTNYFVGYAKKTLVRTFGALDSRFLANSPDPLIAASWRIASSARLTAFEALRINILSSMKQRAKEGNFGLGG